MAEIPLGRKSAGSSSICLADWGLSHPTVAMAKNTTIAVPVDVKNRLNELHAETARDADSAPFWFTIDRSLEAFADEQGVDFSE